MRKVFVSKVLVSVGATGNELEKSAKLVGMITGMKPQITQSGPKTRIPAFSVRPKMPLGARVTLRKKRGLEILKRLLGAIDNEVSEKKVSENHFSFGVKEYIDLPDMEYIREIGSRGFNVTVVFERKGVRVKRKKIKRGSLPKKQHVTREEIMNFMEENFSTKFI